MVSVQIEGVEGQLERTVDSSGRIYISEWKGREVIVLLKPRTYGYFDNTELKSKVGEIIDRYMKDELLMEIEKELSLDVEMTGYNPTDGTIDKGALGRILAGIWRLKERSIPKSRE